MGATQTTATELIGPGPADGLAGLLDLPGTDPARDGRLPPLWHWVYFLDRRPQEDIGPDGHPVRGVLPTPPGVGRRRMWAGGRVEHRGALQVGQEATRSSRVVSSVEKDGRSGHLTLVVVEHVIRQAGVVVIREAQDIVYLEAPPPASLQLPGSERDTTAAAPVGDGVWAIDTTPALLFRFSALTYNAHRIHYDAAYAKDVEGYAGLVVHGPLQGIVMAEAARAKGASGPLRIEYRFVAPLLAYRGLRAHVDEVEGGWDASIGDGAGLRTATTTIRRLSDPSA